MSEQVLLNVLLALLVVGLGVSAVAHHLARRATCELRAIVREHLVRQADTAERQAKLCELWAEWLDVFRPRLQRELVDSEAAYRAAEERLQAALGELRGGV